MYRVRQEELPFVGSSHEFVGTEQGDAGVSVFLFSGLPGKGPGPHRHPYDEFRWKFSSFLTDYPMRIIILSERSESEGPLFQPQVFTGLRNPVQTVPLAKISSPPSSSIQTTYLPLDKQ